MKKKKREITLGFADFDSDLDFEIDFGFEIVKVGIEVGFEEAAVIHLDFDVEDFVFVNSMVAEDFVNNVGNIVAVNVVAVDQVQVHTFALLVDSNSFYNKRNLYFKKG